MKVALVTNIVTPYRVPTWNALVDRGIDLDVCLCAQSHSDRIWNSSLLPEAKYSCTQLKPNGVYLSRWESALRVQPSVITWLKRVNPDRLLVTGYMPFTLLIAMAYAKRNGIPIVNWWGTHAESLRLGSGTFHVLRRTFARLPDVYVTYGSRASCYLRSLGVGRLRIVTSCNTVDVRRVWQRVSELRSSRLKSRSAGRSVRFLYVGQLRRRKGVHNLLRAFAEADMEHSELTIVGYGPERHRLERMSSKLCPDRVSWAGAVNSLDGVCEHYAASDVLVVPSLREVWGLVVNEGLAAGLYTIASSRAGASDDLIRKAPCTVGTVVEPAVPELVSALKLAAQRVESGGVLSASIAGWALEHTPETYASDIARALARA